MGTAAILRIEVVAVCLNGGGDVPASEPVLLWFRAQVTRDQAIAYGVLERDTARMAKEKGVEVKPLPLILVSLA